MAEMRLDPRAHSSQPAAHEEIDQVVQPREGHRKNVVAARDEKHDKLIGYRQRARDHERGNVI